MNVPHEGTQKLTSNQLENLLKNALVMTEVAISLKSNCTSSEKYVTYIRSLLDRANTATAALQSIGLSALKDAKKLISEALNSIDDESMEDSCVTKQDFETLLSIIEKHITAFADFKLEDSFDIDGIDLHEISEKIRRLSLGKKSDHNMPPSSSSKSVRSDVDEKYPGNLSRDSLIDLTTAGNLPPVPEDIFSSFSSANKPMRSSSLSSLKSMRKVKLFLQKAESSDDEENSSDNDEQLLYGDSDEGKTTLGSMKKLGNIKEETQDV